MKSFPNCASSAGRETKTRKSGAGKILEAPNTWFVFRCQYLILISSHMSRKDMVVRTHTGKETVREREGENKTPSGFLLLIIFLARKTRVLN